MQRKGRTLRVRYASLGSALKVKNLSQHVSNELLHQAFSQFGEVERAVVIVDDRGRPTGEGIVEFARKPGAQAAYKRITEGVFLLTSLVFLFIVLEYHKNLNNLLFWIMYFLFLFVWIIE